MVDVTRSGFAFLLAELPTGGGDIAVTERTGLGIATVMVRTNQADAVGRKLGVQLADGPVRSVSDALALLGIGPGAWLMLAQDAPTDWGLCMADELADIASVFDQTSGYAILRISGQQAAALLQKGAFVDLDPGVFPPGSVAVTVIEHIGAILWRLDETTFEIAVFRSFAGSFAHWLVTAAAAAAVTLHGPG